MYAAAVLHGSACPGRCKVWEENEADAHDHKGPAASETLAPSEYRRTRAL